MGNSAKKDSQQHDLPLLKYLFTRKLTEGLRPTDKNVRRIKSPEIKKIPRKLHTTSLGEIMKKTFPSSKTTGLNETKFNLHLFRQTTKDDWETIASNIRKYMRTHKWKRVKAFQFCVQWCNIKENDLLAFIHKIIHSLPDLKSFTFLSFFDYNISDKSIESLGLMMSRNLINLRKLEISFRPEDNLKKGLKVFGSDISKNFPRLERIFLSFYFQNYRRSDNYQLDFHLAIAKHLKHLSKPIFCFSLSFQYRSITDAEFSHMVAQLCPSLVYIKDLSLRFQLPSSLLPPESNDDPLSNCNLPVNENCFNALFSEICTKLVNLEKLQLIITGCGIEKQWAKQLGTMIRNHLINLKHLRLSFKWHSALTLKEQNTLWDYIRRDLRLISKLDLINIP